MTDDTQTTFGKQDVEEGIGREWDFVRSWQSFLDFFEDAVYIDAVTYCESPSLIRDLFSESSEIPTVVESVDILAGDRSEYRTALDDVDTAHRMSELYREGKLTIRRPTSLDKCNRPPEQDLAFLPFADWKAISATAKSEVNQYRMSNTY